MGPVPAGRLTTNVDPVGAAAAVIAPISKAVTQRTSSVAVRRRGSMIGKDASAPESFPLRSRSSRRRARAGERAGPSRRHPERSLRKDLPRQASSSLEPLCPPPPRPRKKPPVPSAAGYARARTSNVSRPLRQLDPEHLGDHFDRLFRAAWAMCGSREDAEDLVQDTYARVLGKRRFMRGEDDLGYLLRVLRNTHVSRLRAANRRLRPGPLWEDLE